MIQNPLVKKDLSTKKAENCNYILNIKINCTKILFLIIIMKYALRQK